MGISSRRKAEILIQQGRVRINGKVAELGDSADPEGDKISVDGIEVSREKRVYWLLNKPRGVLSTCKDDKNRLTVLSVIPQIAKATRLFPVGRLDKDSEGLLLLTNDGDAAQALLHPSLETKRVYDVWITGLFGREESEQFATGFRLPDGHTAPMLIEGIDLNSLIPGKARVRLQLTDGKKRQIRRCMELVGCKVDRLLRIAMGPLGLGSLSSGQSRLLTRTELKDLRRYTEQRRRKKSTS